MPHPGRRRTCRPPWGNRLQSWVFRAEAATQHLHSRSARFRPSGRAPRRRSLTLLPFSSLTIFIKPPQPIPRLGHLRVCFCYLLSPLTGDASSFLHVSSDFRWSVGHFGVFAVETIGFCDLPPESVGSVPRSGRIPGRSTVHVVRVVCARSSI